MRHAVDSVNFIKLLCKVIPCCLCSVQIDNIHRNPCKTLAVTQDGRHLVTVGDKVVKVWDYNMKLDLNFQVDMSQDVFHACGWFLSLLS